MKKSILFLWIIGTALVSAGSIMSLVYWVKADDPRTNGFTREFFPDSIAMVIDTVDLGYDSYYIAGQGTRTVFLGNKVAPRHLIMVDVIERDTQSITLELQVPEGMTFHSVRARIDSPYVYLFDGSVPVLFNGTFGNKEVVSERGLDRFFLDLLPGVEQTFFLQGLDENKEIQVGLMDSSGVTGEFASPLLEKQIDGIFCTDGTMHYSKAAGKFVYLYHYRNEFLVTDSRLRNKDRGHTIDTNRVAKLSVATTTDGRRTVEGRSLLVNSHSAVAGENLYVHSNLISDHESIENFRDMAVIDVYHFSSSTYRGSFYVPERKRDKIRQVCVVGNIMVVIHERELVFYALTNLLKGRS